MASGLDDQELRRRAFAGIEAEVRVFAGASPGGELFERDGVVAALAPAVPDRSLANSVYYEDPAALAASLGELTEVYDSKGVRAWTVWVPDDDQASADLLESRGHVLDASPRLMGMALSEPGDAPPLPDGIEVRDGTAAVAGPLNDIAYGYEGPAFAVMLAGDEEVNWRVAYRGEDPVACVGGIDWEGDCGITAVATVHAERGKGIAARLMWEAISAGLERGNETTTLQASKLGAGVYAGIGYRDLGHAQMWEHRTAPADG